MSSADAWSDAIPVTRIAARLVPQEPVVFSWKLGPALRGAVEKVFRDLVCARPGQSCDRCELRRDCPEPAWFKPGLLGSGRARPFALRVLPPPGDRGRPGRAGCEVVFTFFGPMPAPGEVVEAIRRAAAEGVGALPVAYAVEGLGRAEPEPVPLGALLGEPPRAPGCCTIRLRTPVRPRRDSPCAAIGRELVVAAWERVRAVQRSLGIEETGRWPAPRRVRAVSCATRVVDRSWYSRASRRAIDLSGIVGTVCLDGRLGPYARLLAAMEVLQIGRSTSYGLGAVEVTWEEPNLG